MIASNVVSKHYLGIQLVWKISVAFKKTFHVPTAMELYFSSPSHVSIFSSLLVLALYCRLR